MPKVSQTLKSTVLRRLSVALHKPKMSMKCARDNTCKDLLILPEMKWHPSPALEHRTRNQERLAFCLLLLLPLTLTLCHLSGLYLSLCLSFPIYILQVCRSKLLHVFFIEKSAEKKAKRGKDGMEGQILPTLVCLSKNHGRGESKRNHEGWKH